MYNSRGIRLTSGGKTDTGRIRDNNEDHIYLSQMNIDSVVAIVADGMGGAVAGEEASRIAIETIRDNFLAARMISSQVIWHDGELIHLLKNAITLANSKIIEETYHHPEFRGMGTTVTMAYVNGTEALIGHVGDSRAYHISALSQNIHQITSDHNFVQALVAGGHLTPEEADQHPMGNVLYRVLGQTYDVEVDIYQTQVHDADRILLCSDGLTLHVKADEIREIVLKHDDPEIISQELIQLANERGGRDNISVIVVLVNVLNDEAAVKDNVKEALSSHEDSGHFQIPRENSNMGASEPLTIRESQETRAVGNGGDTVAPPDLTISQEIDEISPDTPGEGRDHLLPEQ